LISSIVLSGTPLGAKSPNHDFASNPGTPLSAIVGTFGSDGIRAGLGLAIVKRIMDLHGQSVRIVSGKGTGTTVEFTLERATTGAAPTRSATRDITFLARTA